MRPRQFQLLLQICERIHEETLKAAPYASNVHPQNGSMESSHYSEPHNLLHAGLWARKTATIEVSVNNEKKIMPAKQFVREYLDIKIADFPADKTDKSLTEALDKKIAELTNDKYNSQTLKELLRKDEHHLKAKKQRKDETIFTNKDSLETLTKNLQKTKVGNCLDRARFNIMAAAEFPIGDYDLRDIQSNNGITIEYFSLGAGFNHAFTVVNRDLKSDPSDPATWGKHAVIIDSWWNLHGQKGVSQNKGVFAVADELDNPGGQFKYIMRAREKGELKKGVSYACFGEGHTAHWNSKGANSLCDYSDLGQLAAEDSVKIFQAIKNNNIDEVKAFLRDQCGGLSKRIDTINAEKESLLTYAVLQGHFDIVKEIVKYSPNLLYTNSYGNTAANIAHQFKHHDIFNYCYYALHNYYVFDLFSFKNV